MKRLLRYLTFFLATLVFVACSGSKGTASLDSTTQASTSTTKTPRIKSDEALQAVADEAESSRAEKTVVVREEAVTIVETLAVDQSGKYHIVIGSFKSLENARKQCEEAIADGYLPSIMENEDGLYRVAIYTGDEKAARQKIAELREDTSKYIGIWLLVEKR